MSPRIEEHLHILWGHRPRDQEALAEITVVVTQARNLLLVLNPFRDRVNAELRSEMDEGPDDGGRFFRRLHVSDEGLVDLQDVDRELSEVGQGRVAGPKIVNGDTCSKGLQPLKGGSHLRGIPHEDRFRDFDDETSRIETRDAQRISHVLGELSIHELNR